ncbi:hypothetical protein [Vreelandella nanhaiensis]|uniref:Uncharacterized protein n=1 Tax=Vreelandella nanhaiensis TaxID=1258546 RepID=A0A3S0WME2_9GAMM|nr:hypothetical protein [Halomonas nanhaiensis]RUR33023.1 hypothetical protein ELY38_05585 [Halomonas nanhaiensis]
MRPDEHERVILELETLIQETQATIDQAEARGLDKAMPADYAYLLDILDKAVKQQREHTLAMLKDDN